MTSPIFYIPADDAAALKAGASYALLGEEGHHAKTVKRMEVGEGIDLSDGSGTRFVGQVQSILDEGLQVKVFELEVDKPEPAIYLVQALAKHDRDLLGIETATELGIAGVVPWAADRSIVQWKGERAAKAHGKWEKTVFAAAKQARRAWVPEVYDLYTSKNLVELIEEAVAEGAAVFVLHEQENRQLTSALADFAAKVPQEIYLIVGPEGGISDREVQLFTAAGARAVLLGREILRSSTAGSAAIATINTVLGRW